MREGDPYRLLGLTKDADFEEVIHARNFLFEEYRWHEPSRESIELAFDSIIKEKFKHRQSNGFQGPGGVRGRRLGDTGGGASSLSRRISDLFDPTITLRTLANEGLVYLGLALWVLSSTDPSFPMAGAFAYSVYKFQVKRLRTNPEGPFLGGNPMIGALLTTLANLAVACGVMALLTVPITAVYQGSVRALSACLTILIMGALGVYLK